MNKCKEGHRQPKEHSNRCDYCVALFGFSFPDRHKKKGRKSERNQEKVRLLRGELKKYMKGFNILMEHFDSINDEDKLIVGKRLREIGL